MGIANGYFTSEEIRSIEAARKYDDHASFVLAALAFPPPHESNFSVIQLRSGGFIRGNCVVE